MRSLKYTNLFTILAIIALFLFDEHLSHAQYRQTPAHLDLELWRIENNIAAKNRYLEQAEDRLDQVNLQVSQKLRQVRRCERRYRFSSRFFCRRLIRELVRIQNNQIHWQRISDKHLSEKRNLTARRDQLNQQIEREKNRRLCIAQSRNRLMINEILNVDETKIAQEIDYDNIENRRCNNENNYFESQIDTAHDNGDFDPSIDRRCTYRALKRYNECGNRDCFLKCEGSNPQNAQPKFVRTGPCISRRLHHYAHQALTEVSSCFQLDPKILFTLFAKESGFHPLKKSYTKATGMGQITGIFIEDINTRFFDNYKNDIIPALAKNPSTKKACESIIDKMNDHGKIEKFPLCQRTDLYMNVLYSAIFYIKSMDAITKKLLAHQNRSNIAIPRNSPFQDALSADTTRRTRNLFKTLAIYQTLTPNEQRIITELSFYSHNLPRTSTIFQSYLIDTREEGDKLGDDFTGIRGRWRRYLENNRAFISSKENRQNEVLGYIYPRTEGQGGFRRVERGGGRDFMSGRLHEIEREGRNRERIHCRAYWNEQQEND